MTVGVTLPEAQETWEGEPSLVRVAVLGDGKLADMALPTDLPLREIVPATRRLVGPESDGEGARRLSLAPLGGEPFSLDATLDAVGVVDGDLLVLQPLPVGPSAASVVEDIADAAALAGSRIGPEWNAAAIRRVATATVVAFLLLASFVAAAWWRHGGGLPARSALVLVALVSVAAGLSARFRFGRAVVPLSVAALLPIVLAAAAVVPGAFAAPHVLLAAAAAAAWSALCVFLPARAGSAERASAFFVGAATFSLAVLLVSAARVLAGLSAPSEQCALILFGLAVTVAAPSLSVLLARLPLPDLPAPGDPLPAPAEAGALADLPRKARFAASSHTGLIAGATLALVVGAVALPQAARGGWAAYVALATIVATALRARVPAGIAAKTWLASAPALAGVLGAAACAREGRWPLALAITAALGVIVAVWLVVAARPKLADPEGYSLPARRAVSLVALALDASLIPVMAYVCGLFQWVLAG